MYFLDILSFLNIKTTALVINIHMFPLRHPLPHSVIWITSISADKSCIPFLFLLQTGNEAVNKAEEPTAHSLHVSCV